MTKKKTSKKTKALHARRFPGESAKYRAARDTLLKAEAALRSQIEDVAALRRKLPLGGPIAEDYAFDDAGGRRVRLSELFADGKDTLLVYNYMFGPAMAEPCPLCTSIIDGLDASAPHVSDRASLVVVARSPIARVTAFAREHGWRHVRLLSSVNNTYNQDYFGEDDHGSQWPMLNVFIRRGGRIHHSWGSELFFVPQGRGRDMRHVDMIWPLWNLLDLTPEGRGTNWYPKLRYQ